MSLISSEKLEAKKALWQLGIIAPWYLRYDQMPIYELLVREQYPFIECSRRYGKTTTILTHCLEVMKQKPGTVIRWCEPFKNQAREIVMPEVEKIQKDQSKEHQIEFKTIDSFYIHQNGSRLYLRGVNEDRGESARGAFAHIIVADEYGSWKDPDYIIKDVLRPQLLTTNGQLIKASTPPKDLGHLYYEEKDTAQKLGRFIQRTIYDNKSLTIEQIENECREQGGAQSASWLREYLCQPVSNPDDLVIPEFSEEENVVSNDYPRPEGFEGFVDKYVAGDSGHDDFTFIIFGYYDFINQETIIEDEIVINGASTSTIVNLAKNKELTLWQDCKPRSRVYDADKQLVYDIMSDHQWYVTLPKKDEKHAAIHELRVDVHKRKFKIKQRCVNLIRQLKIGMWKDDKHTDFQRSHGLGHLDGIAAAIYFNRSVDKKRNPYPLHHNLSIYTHHLNPQASDNDKLKKAFGGGF